REVATAEVVSFPFSFLAKIFVATILGVAILWPFFLHDLRASVHTSPFSKRWVVGWILHLPLECPKVLQEVQIKGFQTYSTPIMKDLPVEVSIGMELEQRCEPLANINNRRRPAQCAMKKFLDLDKKEMLAHLLMR
ncbi:hypothetical protein FRX31_023059, partial [Thalictrum thalictroides]